MPPSDNQTKASFRGRIISTKKKRDFDRSFDLWARALPAETKDCIRKFRTVFNSSENGLTLCIVLNFSEERLLTKNGETKKLDAMNHTKSLIDKISELIGIDDRHIFSCTVKKQISQDDNETVYVDIVGALRADYLDKEWVLS